MPKEKLEYSQSRELSWLRFNQRVLHEAKDETVPLLERMKFVAIFTSNLDEFFMIRVGSLHDLMEAGKVTIDRKSGMTPNQELDAIYAYVAQLYKERDKTYGEIKKKLSPYGIMGLDMKELDQVEKKYVKKYFKDEIVPLLSPQIIDTSHPFPHLINKEIYIVANLKTEEKSLKGIVSVPQFISDVLYLPGDSMRYIRIEKIIMEYFELIFEQYEVSDKNYICVTRNADVAPEDEALADNEDFRFIMQKTLHKRRRMAAVRLEVFSPLCQELETYFCEKLQITPQCIFRTKMPVKLDYIFVIADKIPLSLKYHLIYKPFIPQPSVYESESSVIELIRKRDILLHYPYESMELFLRLIREASTNLDVLTIKITIYRLARQSRVIEYLCAAAENGKEVTVLIELRARFDEQNNIEWSKRLEESGCRVIYGMEGYKVHSKVCLITCRHKNEIQYITQVGTGNYNEKTARLYTDYSLMTAHKEIGADANLFFKNMAIGNLNGIYKHLFVAPFSLKTNIFKKIEDEIAKGSDGHVIMKMNSLTDIDFMDKIEEASIAGVKINLIVRGICCILPGLEGKTDHITVTSIVGRFLEHPRVYAFGTGVDRQIYIGSADMMTRNTDTRVEVTCPVLDPQLRKRLSDDLDLMLADNVKARVMDNQGIYSKIKKDGPIVNSQDMFMEMAMHAKPIKEPVEERGILVGFGRKLKKRLGERRR
ncbi:MAG: polyphosphate kinase 1 [Lachnospiraceae bacterium]|nr:polyphosphate kinase 1 [Lachnospiraceae bacterium]